MDHLLASSVVAFAALFPIVDPIGNVASYVPLTAGREMAWQRRQATLGSVASALMLSVFLLAGHNVLSFFDVSLAAVEVVGGLIIGWTGWDMVMHTTRPEVEDPTGDEDVWFHPLAFPLLAGPGALAVVLGLSNRNDSWIDFPGFIIGIVGICLVALAAMWFAGPLSNRLGPKGLDVIERVMGILVLAIAAELVFHGIEDHFGITSTHS